MPAPQPSITVDDMPEILGQRKVPAEVIGKAQAMLREGGHSADVLREFCGRLPARLRRIAPDAVDTSLQQLLHECQQSQTLTINPTTSEVFYAGLLKEFEASNLDPARVHNALANLRSILPKGKPSEDLIELLTHTAVQAEKDGTHADRIIEHIAEVGRLVTTSVPELQGQAIAGLLKESTISPELSAGERAGVRQMAAALTINPQSADRQGIAFDVKPKKFDTVKPVLCTLGGVVAISVFIAQSYDAAFNSSDMDETGIKKRNVPATFKHLAIAALAGGAAFAALLYGNKANPPGR